MNKTHLPKSIGTFVRLEPPAESSEGAPLDDDWLIADVDTAAGFIELANSRNSQRTRIALDGVYSFHDDANRTTASKKFGFLVLLVQVQIAAGGVEVRPLPSPRQPARGRSTHPSLAEEMAMRERFEGDDDLWFDVEWEFYLEDAGHLTKVLSCTSRLAQRAAGRILDRRA